MLHISARLQDGSKLELRDYLYRPEHGAAKSNRQMTDDNLT